MGWGRSQVTPRAAFKAWKESRGHWLNMVKPEHKEMRVAVASGSADPDAGSTRPALTYVQMFGGCEQ
ncbi:CAP domain-containing protein [Nonomuraea sp. NPDC003201]